MINRLGGIKEYQKEYMKEYRKLNKDKLVKNKKEYCILNKDKINEKHKCECGGKYTHKHKSRHFKTKKHIQYIEQQNKDV